MMYSSLLNTFNPENSKKTDFIAGLFRRGHISLLAAEPGLGKSILIQKLICDLSVGGAVFDGFCVSEPMTIMLFCGEVGLAIMNERLSNTGWPFDRSRVKVLDSREARRTGYIPALDNDERDMFSSLIEEAKPDLIIVDSLGSFVSDESDRGVMKKVFDFLLALGDRYKCAILLVHHLRKRKNGEKSLPLAQSEVIGSSIIALHASLLNRR